MPKSKIPSQSIPKQELMDQIQNTIDNLVRCHTELNDSKLKYVRIYTNSDNGGYSDDASHSDHFGLSVSVDEDEDEKVLIFDTTLEMTDDFDED